jgi:hypothetical protein
LEEERLVGCINTSEKSYIPVRRDDISYNQVMNSSIQKEGNNTTIIIRVYLTLIADDLEKRKKRKERQKTRPL